MYDMADERRQFVRFENIFDDSHKTAFLSVEIPELAEGPIQPEDLSTGGFRINVAERPEVGAEIKCAVRVFESILPNVSGQVVRVDKIESSPSWSVAVSLRISDAERDILSSLLTVLISRDRSWKF